MFVGAVMDAAARFMLLAEYPPTMLATPRCVICGAEKPAHEIDCVADIALSEKGFYTAADRDAARIRLEFTSKTTAPAPASTPDLDDPAGRR